MPLGSGTTPLVKPLIISSYGFDYTLVHIGQGGKSASVQALCGCIPWRHCIGPSHQNLGQIR